MSSTIAKGLILGYLVFSVISCKEDENKTVAATPEVNVILAGKQNIPVYSEYVGQIYGLTDVNIDPRVEGWITGIYFKEGSLVQKGSLLYTIDDVPILNQLEAAKAEVARTQVMMLNKKSELDRVKPLAAMNALSQRDLDDANAAYEASVNEEKIAEARLANTRIQLTYTKMTSPITGIIGISKVQVGDYVQRVSLGTGINAVSSLGDVRVRFPISENDYLNFAREYRKDPKTNNFQDVPVDLILGDGSVFGEKGHLQLTNRQIDPATGSILIQALFKNSSGILRPGQYVKVRFKTGEYNNAIVIPQQSVNQLQNIFQVFLLTDSNKLKPTLIKVGNRVGSNWIVNEGLKEGDKVVIVGSTFLNPSMVVKPVIMKWNYDSTSKD
ncbi:MAG TPA: efflux RND transporter periplasmic adaptor subunit [Puia sp.]|jgi:membrane fusion protein (multidrug efflux system)|nr:efflux RND transporter periplasmic adaptor subunit [Puia sp.]